MTTENSVRVPRVPNDEMLDAGIGALLRCGNELASKDEARICYSAMVASRPHDDDTRTAANGSIQSLTQVSSGERVMPEMNGYRMQCCDCDLIHVVDFEVREVLGKNPDGSFRTGIPENVERLRIILSARRETAAPAPAGCNCASGRGAEHCAVHAPADEFGPVTEAELDAARAPNPLIVTPQPEQGAGLQTLADEWAHAIRNGVMDDGEGDGPMFYATEEWALNMLESIRALARQQSRVVDEVLKLAEQMDRDSAQCRRDGYFDAAVIKSDCANRIRAALEGGRDGR